MLFDWSGVRMKPFDNFWLFVYLLAWMVEHEFWIFQHVCYGLWLRYASAILFIYFIAHEENVWNFCTVKAEGDIHISLLNLIPNTRQYDRKLSCFISVKSNILMDLKRAATNKNTVMFAKQTYQFRFDIWLLCLRKMNSYAYIYESEKH